MNKYLSHSGALRFPNIGGKFKKPDFSRVKPTYPRVIPELCLPTTVNKPIANIQILPFDHSTEGSLKKL